jgi:hypothetical protein
MNYSQDLPLNAAENVKIQRWSYVFFTVSPFPLIYPFKGILWVRTGIYGPFCAASCREKERLVDSSNLGELSLIRDRPFWAAIIPVPITTKRKAPAGRPGLRFR